MHVEIFPHPYLTHPYPLTLAKGGNILGVTHLPTFFRSHNTRQFSLGYAMLMGIARTKAFSNSSSPSLFLCLRVMKIPSSVLCCRNLGPQTQNTSKVRPRFFCSSKHVHQFFAGHRASRLKCYSSIVSRIKLTMAQ